MVAERFIKMQRGHAEALLPALAEIKREAADIWAQIDVLAVTVGPGTFPVCGSGYRPCVACRLLWACR